MSQRLRNVLLGTASLVLGGFIYVMFRENAFIAKCFEQLEFILRLRNMMGFCSNDFLKYYFPDFLWGFSLCCGLHVIYEPQVKGSLMCGLMALFCGIAWELLQFWKFVGGTGDYVDIIMYLLASCTCIIINLKERKK